MKKIYLALTAFLLLALNALSAKGYTTISKDGYAISFPSSWYVDYSANKKKSSDNFLLRPFDAPQSVYILIFISDLEDFTFERFVGLDQIYNASFKKEYKLINKRDGGYNGLNYKEVKFSYARFSKIKKEKLNGANSKINILVTQRYYKKNTKFYQISFSSSESVSDKFKVDAMKILNSFKFK